MILRLFLVIALVLTWISVREVAAVEPGGETWDPEVLRGLCAVVVAVRPLSPDASRAGLAIDELRLQIEQALAHAGIPVLKEPPLALAGEARGAPEWALLRLSVDDFAQGQDSAAFHDYWFTLELVQEVALVRHPEVRSPVVTWSRVATGTHPAGDIAPLVRETLAAALADLARDYRAVNGARDRRLPPVASGAGPDAESPEGD